MAEENTNPAATATETPPTTGAEAPEGQSTAEASKSGATPDWYKSIPEDASDEDLEKHPRLAKLKDRWGQAHADKVYLKDRQRIAQEVESEVRKQAESKDRERWWNSLTREQRAEHVLRSQEMSEEMGKTIAQWWITQSADIKSNIPSLKDKPIEEWNEIFKQHPDSFGKTIAVLAQELAEDMMAKELPKRVREGIEAGLKEKVRSTVAGQHVDLSGGGTSARNFTRDDLRAMSPKEYAENRENIMAQVGQKRR